MTTSFEFDHAYLRTTVAAPLTEAMAQLAVLQPEDPVEFLGNFLLKYVQTEQQKQEQAKRGNKPPSTPAPHAQSTNNNSSDQADLAALELILTQERSLQERLPQANTIQELFDMYLQWLAPSLNAEEAYVGRKTADPSGTSIVHWVASSRGAASNTVDKFISKANETITFDAFEVVPQSEDAPPALDAEGNPLPPTVPKFIHVENVLREPRLKFFHVPKLGAYLTRGLQFKSFLHADVVNEANVEEPTIKDEWLVVSADTMGQARAFTAMEIDSFQRTTSLFVHAVEALERKLYMADMARRSTDGEDAQLKEYSIAFAAQVAVQEENLMLQLQSLPEDDKTLKESELREAFMTYLLVTHTPTIALAASRIVPFKLPVLAVFATTLGLLGYRKEELFNSATKLPAWEKLAPLLKEEALKPKLEAFALPASSVVAQARQQVAEVAKGDVEAASAIAASLLTWLHAVFAHADQVDAAAERARVAAEEAAAAAAAETEE